MLDAADDSCEEEECLPDRPGIVTPLAPTTESMTPCAKTLVAVNATRRIAEEYCILRIVGSKGWKWY